MSSFVISLLLVFVIAAFSAVLFFAYLRIRGIGNSVLALASKEFNERLSSLLVSSSELPDEVLEYLEFLVEKARTPRGHFEVYSLLKNKDKLSADRLAEVDKRSKEFAKVVEGMRPELISILSQINQLWLNIMMSRNILIGLLIDTELTRRSVGHGSIEPEFSRTASELFNPNNGSKNGGGCLV